ncbi:MULTISPECIES: 5-methylcytosine-specific restriction endonuclease system specificity protein McrC [Staphylococcus]|uniref:5-methylcytosine-specific restriction endonuclease system specificity protein McrC n=1 Tax=Staphylococcus pettenkoferi TaxID=170573 RepID=A0A2N6QHL4_9STAP|nr:MULTISPECIES: 5-methylcytosine-specific restriction endonuclease system specificity protein McrC [Staphylococcus]MBX8993059.1 5-methylcytosine-specific restriction endonuclease system specificity protein McrC [Staphylococcus pettenkoferi]MCI2791512.1 5-methylcytosine-specific restriction endonuclease system specificity protein McrC [Staphylococcus pettenkoferi]MCY1567211.1 5-methylcytosine-specific restriction endonuclease system specificity protein McrC [Staphylococcus pettenkoferi]MCY15884
MIKINNIYYMLSYAFTVLKEDRYKNLATEDFENSTELYAAILIRGLSNQVKRGLHHEYIEEEDALSTIRGKINVTRSIKDLDIVNKRLHCSFDEYSPNNYMNQIIKTTLTLLLKSDIPKKRKKEIKRLTFYFEQVDTLNYRKINWNLRFTSNNRTYKMLISICNLIIEGLIQTTREGNKQFMDFVDEQRMSRLYEKFILEYYKKEFPELSVSASHIPWVVDDGITTMLPLMKSDIMLSYKGEYLIIDAKYYGKTVQNFYNTPKMHSGNLYQIFTYVKNLDVSSNTKTKKVSGMLLYAKTDEAVTPNQTFQMSGNQISVTTLDLGGDFFKIEEKLNQIVDNHFERN